MQDQNPRTVVGRRPSAFSRGPVSGQAYAKRWCPFSAGVTTLLSKLLCGPQSCSPDVDWGPVSVKELVGEGDDTTQKDETPSPSSSPSRYTLILQRTPFSHSSRCPCGHFCFATLQQEWPRLRLLSSQCPCGHFCFATHPAHVGAGRNQLSQCPCGHFCFATPQREGGD